MRLVKFYAYALLALLSILAGGIGEKAHAALSPPFPVATSPNKGISASVAFDGTNYLVAILGDSTNPNNVTAQIISQTGARLGSRISVGRTGGLPIAAFDGTNYLLVWEDYGASPDNDIYGQLISPSGALVGSPFAISAAAGKQSWPCVTFDGLNYLVVWQDSRNDANGNGQCDAGEATCDDIYGRFVSTSGALSGPELAISVSAEQDKTPTVNFDGTNYLIAYEVRRSGPELWDVYGRFIGTTGVLSSPFVISETPSPAYNPAGIAFDGTNYLVVWNKDVGSGWPNPVIWDIYGRLVTTSGTFPGTEFVVTSASGGQSLIVLAFDGTKYLALWTDGRNDANINYVCDAGEGSCADIYGQYISTSGAIVGPETAIITSSGDQFLSPALFAAGKMLILWNSGYFSMPISGALSEVYGAFLSTPNTAPALAYSSEAGYGTDGLYPNSGTSSTLFTYKIVYTDAENNAPSYVKVCIDGVCSNMAVDTGVATLSDGIYTNGEQYSYTTTRPAGSHTYYFTASDGTLLTRLPSTGALSGPTVSTLKITTVSLVGGKTGLSYGASIAATGGTPPYSWAVPGGGLPPGLALNASTGAITGTPTAEGVYAFTAQVTDANSFVYGKSLSITVTTPVIDLIVSALSAPASAQVGKTAAISTSIKNQGTTPSVASTVKIYLSTDGIIDEADTYLGTRAVPILAPGAVNTGAQTLALPAGIPPGPYYIGAIADASNANPESNEANNTGARPIVLTQADLVFSSISGPGSTIWVGGTAQITTGVRNIGTAPSVASTVKFYLSTDAVIDAADAYIGSRAVGILAPGATSVALTNLTIPATTTPGVYYVGAIADATNTNIESDETNNAIENGTSNIASGVDLLVTAVSAPLTAQAGKSIVVTSTVKNIGNLTTAVSDARVCLSSDNVVDAGDTCLPTTRTVLPLTRNALSTGTVTNTVPAGITPGAYYVCVKADSANQNSEFDETNNTRCSLTTTAIGNIDLTVSVSITATSVSTGGTLTINNTVYNSGTTASLSSSVRFYLSADTAFDAMTDTLIGARAVPSIGAGLQNTAATTFSISAAVPAGSYYIVAVADALNTNVESNESNNTSSSPSSLTVVNPNVVTPGPVGTWDTMTWDNVVWG